ncbi:hypothetical protein RD792_009439 [Penstemon davidsonii]|uniref:Inositol polyphosphate-related phosphatase domain-containing protein n=1 Tax=Penstemon davidsonii TaxID=160366 RepID=A0ABR0CZ08_9LAMI|nr:hypothetical protein RD792_009439 [Penstemon davidsonii]
MRDENTKKSKLFFLLFYVSDLFLSLMKVSWPKTLVKKWFNIKTKAQDFHADDVTYAGVDEELRNNSAEREACTIKKSKTEKSNRRNSDRYRRSKIDLDASQITDVDNYRFFVATWNVAGKSPPNHLNLEEWLHTSPPADVYVLGFQEIVPLNAGNVLGTEDNGPAKKWLSLIRKTLNTLPGISGSCRTPSPVSNPIVELDDDFEGSNREKASQFFHRRSFQSLSRSMRVIENDLFTPQPRLDRRFSVCDRTMYGNRQSDDYYDPNMRWDCSSDDENGPNDSPYAPYSPFSYNGRDCVEERTNSRYCLVASKQMVGIFLTVWIRSDLRDAVRSLKVSCVGRGLMGYLGNKLRIEQRQGRVFPGWNEGKIYFPPTYKYSNNSDRYAGENMHPKEKRRTPAWCDRILWHGRGIKQLSYVRGESRFSDHRPVYGIFLVEVESINRNRFKKSTSYSSARVEVEELLPFSHGYGQLNFF